ncbi:protein DYAD-like isoform X2 [Spinacia oleracea]|nr:protein DYAD-like isoform X2 [Spinacia oleracea]
MEIEMGSIFKLDRHSNAKLPAALSSIKAVFVNHKSDVDVTVVFPSIQSIESFFKNLGKNGLMQPNLDEHCVMGLNLAKKLLTQNIPFAEFVAQRGNRSFWVHDVHDDDDDDDDGHHQASNGGLEIKWEKRRRTTTYGRAERQKSMSTVLPCELKGKAPMADEEEEEKEDDEDQGDENEDEKVPEKSRALRKRKCRFKRVGYSEKKKKMQIKTVPEKKKFKDSQHRWTVERYKLAEKNMLKILKEQGSGPGNPILRPDLRSEARKLIGDTGLLDHLLKHMAGKLAPGGKERFRRRHNPEGAMEYWLESADLIEARKQAGVVDPYWVPPPGWKPGDCPNQDPVCAIQLKELKDEIADMKREMQKLGCKGKVTNQALIDDPISLDESIKSLKASQAELMKRKDLIEKFLLEISDTFSGMEEDIGMLQETIAEEKEGEHQLFEEEANKGKTNDAVNKDEILEDKQEQEMITQSQKLRALSLKTSSETTENKENRKQTLKSSSFRICKPQGTFLWPSQMVSSSSSASSSQVLVHLEDLLGYPTPPSVSSSSSCRSPRVPYKPLSPVQVKRPIASRAALTLNFSVANIRGSATIDSICSPTATTVTGCSSVHSFVPDLNEIPHSSYT